VRKFFEFCFTIKKAAADAVAQRRDVGGQRRAGQRPGGVSSGGGSFVGGPSDADVRIAAIKVMHAYAEKARRAYQFFLIGGRGSLFLAASVFLPLFLFTVERNLSRVPHLAQTHEIETRDLSSGNLSGSIACILSIPGGLLWPRSSSSRPTVPNAFLPHPPPPFACSPYHPERLDKVLEPVYSVQKFPCSRQSPFTPPPPLSSFAPTRGVQAAPPAPALSPQKSRSPPRTS